MPVEKIAQQLIVMSRARRKWLKKVKDEKTKARK